MTTELTVTADEIIRRMRHIGGHKTDRDLSASLEVAFQTIASWRWRNSVPPRIAMIFALRHGISYEHLLNPDIPAGAAPQAGATDEAASDGFADRLRDILYQRRLSIRDAAGLTGLPVNSLSNYLGGHQKPGLEAIVAICRGLGIGADWLVLGQLPGRSEADADELLIKRDGTFYLARRIQLADLDGEGG